MRCGLPAYWEGTGKLVSELRGREREDSGGKTEGLLFVLYYSLKSA